MNKSAGLVLLAVGIFLLIAGLHASQSFSSDVSRFFTGSATNKAVWMLLGGVAATVAGAVLLNLRNS